MKFLLILAVVTVTVQNALGCLKGWDISLAMRENKLNGAYLKAIVDTFGSQLTFPTFEHAEPAVIPTGQPWGLKSTIKLQGIQISKLQIVAMSGQDHVGKLSITFSAGECIVSKQLVLASGDPMPGVPPSAITYPFAGQTISFRVRVTSYKIALINQGGDHYDIKLVIVEDDAIIGALEWKDLSVFDSQDIRKALTTLVQRALVKNKEYELAEFDLPTVGNANVDTLIADLFPAQIRFVFLYVANDRSVFAALTSTSNAEPANTAFHWSETELVDVQYDSTVKISADKLFNLLMRSINSIMKIPAGVLKLDGDCPKKIVLNSRHNDFQGDADLVRFAATIHGDNELNIYLRLWDNVSPGVDVDIDVTVRFRLSYNNDDKKIELEITKKEHDTDYHKDWWVVLLEVVTLGVTSLVVFIITEIADDVIDGKMKDALKFDNLSGGIPMNVQGPLKVVIDNLSVGRLHFDSQGNLAFSIAILIDIFASLG